MSLRLDRFEHIFSPVLKLCPLKQAFIQIETVLFQPDKFIMLTEKKTNA